jgi:hypothetical protein
LQTNPSTTRPLRSLVKLWGRIPELQCAGSVNKFIKKISKTKAHQKNDFKFIAETLKQALLNEKKGSAGGGMFNIKSLLG